MEFTLFIDTTRGELPLVLVNIMVRGWSGDFESVILGADVGEGDGVGANQFEVLKEVQSRRL